MKLKRILALLAVIPLLCLTLAGCAAPLTVEITSPTDGAELTESPVMVSVTVSNPEATIKVNGIEAYVPDVDGSLSAQVELTEGENIITAVATLGEQEVSDSITVTYTPAAPPLSLGITSPEDGAELTESSVTVSGTVSDPEAAVTINDEEVEVAEAGSFTADVELTYGENTITVTAIMEEQQVRTIITVSRVLAVGITSLQDGAELAESPVTVSGIVSDAEATVTVNDEEVEIAEDASFSTQVELTEGENIITVVAVLGEQEVSDSITVTYTPAE